jgi:hypothetical protein
MVQLAWGKTLANSLHQRTLRLSMTPGLLMGETSLENLELKWRIAWGAHRGLDPRARKAHIVRALIPRGNCTRAVRLYQAVVCVITRRPTAPMHARRTGHKIEEKPVLTGSEETNGYAADGE